MDRNSRFWPILVLLNILVISSATCGEFTGNTQIDSLRKVADTKPDIDNISSQLDLAFQLIDTNTDEAQRLANSALQSAQTIENKELEIRSYTILGSIFIELGRNRVSLAYFDTAMFITEAANTSKYKGEIMYGIGVNRYRMGESMQALKAFNSSVQACRLSDNYKVMGSSYSMMGTIFRMNGLYDRAIEYIIKSKLNYEKADFKEGSAWAVYLLGRIYSDLKLPEKALEYFQDALQIYSEVTPPDGNQNGLAICYEQLGLLHMELGNFNEARKNINNTLKIYSDNPSKYGMSNVQTNLGKIEYYTGNYLQAEKYLNKALIIKKEEENILGLPGIYEYLGLCLIKRDQIEEGFSTIQQGLDLALSNNQIKIQLDIYARLTEAYLSLNDLGNAIACQNKQIAIQNLILSGDANIKTEQLQAIYELDEKNSHIAELEKQNEINTLSIKQHRLVRNIMITGIVLALLITSVLLWFYNQIRRNNRELHETNATKDKFFAIIAHDLRGPTGALASLLEHLHSSFDTFNKIELKKILTTLHNSAENVSSLLENLLIWAQSQVNKIEYQPTKLKLSDVLQDTLKGLIQSVENKQIDIRLEINDQIFVSADPNLVQTILRNILSNAIKFTHRGGKVLIKSAFENPNNALITITDNGVGIEELNLSKLFDISNTYHTKGTEEEESTGLGLILVKDFVERNKGTLNINSEVDKGTTVSFTLPLAQTIPDL